jgi:hypothetical protein
MTSNRIASHASFSFFTILALALGVIACGDDPATPSSAASEVCGTLNRYCPDLIEAEYGTVSECRADFTAEFQDEFDSLSADISTACATGVMEFWECVAGTIRSCSFETGISPVELESCFRAAEQACGFTYDEYL